MSTVTRRAKRPQGFADPHELLPRRFSHVYEILALGAILAGDAVAFQQIIAVAMAQSSTRVTWALVGALSAAATVSMHLAGVSARRRQAGAHQAGLLWSCCLVLAWLGLGGMALWFRLANAAAHETPAASGGVFGTTPVAGAATEIPLAALMLGLYLVGGITAYGIGYGMHNPARSAYLRAWREHRRASRAHRWATWRRHRAMARSARPTSGMVSQRVLAAFTPGPHPTVPSRTRPGVAVDLNPSGVDTTDELTVRRDLMVARTRAQADQLREVARHQLAAALAEPARTSGVFDGHPQLATQPHIDLI